MKLFNFNFKSILKFIKELPAAGGYAIKK